MSNEPDKVILFSGHKPTTEDMEALQQFLRDHPFAMFDDTFIFGVLRGNANELEVTIPDPGDYTKANVATGAAWIKDNSDVQRDERVQVAVAEDVTLDNAATYDNIVYIKAKQTEGTFKTHYISGVSYATRSTAGYELGAIRESSWPVANAMPLAKVGDNGGRLDVLEDLRDFLILRPGFADTDQELNVTMPILFASAVTIQGPIQATIKPEPGSLRSKILVKALVAQNANIGHALASGSDINIGIWDDSDKTTQSHWVNIKGLASQATVENVTEKIIGDVATDHRFRIGFQDASIPTMHPTVNFTGLVVVNLTIRYQLLSS